MEQVPKVLRALLAENTKLASALEGYRRREKAEDLVAVMDARGFTDRSTPFKDKVAALLSSEKDLDVVKEALALHSPDLSFATLSDQAGQGGATSALEDFLLGN